MKRSFLRKLMVGTMGILGLTFFIQLLLQTQVLPLFVINETKNNIEALLEQLDRSADNYNEILETLSSATGTFNSLVDPREVQSQQYDFRTITLTTSEGLSYRIIQPRTTGGVRIGTSISGSFYTTNKESLLVPITLTINNRMVFGSERIGELSPDIQEQLGVNNERLELTGNITSIQQILISSARESYTNSELLNLMSGSNIENVVQLNPYTLRYESIDDQANPLNLVYVTQIRSQASDYLLFTIFPLSNITLITAALARFNMIIFVIALLLISVLYFFYFKRISIPLIEINRATKRFASLDFTPIDPVESDDEIGELSKNINYLSANLSNAMSMLHDQNKVLSQQLESEQAQEQQRKDFLAGVSHELKTPLAIIQATYEAIKEGVFAEEELPEHYQTIENEILRANRIIQEMMQIYRVDQGHLELKQETIAMKGLLIANQESYQPLLDQAQLTLELSADDSEVIGDTEQLQLVISNLLSNAIKYASPDSVITIIWKNQTLQIQNHTTVTEQKDLDRLVEPFYRSDKSRSRTQGSTGLGLYIVKQILDLHGFSLDLSMDNGLFTVYIHMDQQ